MSIDGITIHAIARELDEKLSGAHIKKIAQPEKEELIITASKERQTHRLLISASPSLPVVYLTPENKESPMTAPNFCMLLRKYIGSGRISKVSHVGMERVIAMEIEHLNELGDPAKKLLYIEVMGKYSNIILVDSDGTILDAIRHVSAAVSSVREVLPGREYFIPVQENHYNLFDLEKEAAYNDIFTRPVTIRRMFFDSLTGFGPVMAEELCNRLDIDSDASVLSLSEWQKDALYDELIKLRDRLNTGDFTPTLISDKKEKPIEIYPFSLSVYDSESYLSKTFASISEALYTFYATKNLRTNMDQKSHDLKKQVQTLLERNSKKLDLQTKQYRDTDSMDKYRLYGELLTANAYLLESGMKKVTVNNYYDGTDVTIPLDDTLPIMDNANRYYTKYNKLKRTREALETQIEETKKAITHLQSIMAAIGLAESESELSPLKQELYDYGFTKKRPDHGKGKNKGKQRPLHYVTDDGYDIYVGKNNYQNEEVTFKIASGGDWWFHTKTIPGSHVIVKSKGEPELPDHIYEIAASLAAYYSTGRDTEKVEIDYVQRKELRKVAGAAPGYVIYHTNYSMVAKPEISEGLSAVQ